MNEELLYELEVLLYIRSYTQSNSTRSKYYQKDKREIPLKYCNKDHYKATQERIPDEKDYTWKSFEVTRDGKKISAYFLYNIFTKKRILANEEKVGKPRYKNINGQDIYNGSVARHDRNNMLGAIKDFYRDHFKSMPPITRYPIRIKVYLFDTIIDDVYSNSQEWDLDNRFFPYGKGLSDLLKKEGKIIDDSILYITESPHPIFVPVEEDTQRKFVIKIFKDNRPCILNHYLYKAKHGRNLI